MSNLKRTVALVVFCAYIAMSNIGYSQINTDQVLNIGKNAMYFEDYILSIQYFNQVISAKPYLAEPYFYRSVAKLSLEDYNGAESDASLAIERNPFIVDAYQVRGIARQNLKMYHEAIADYDKGLDQLPENKSFLYNKAVAQTELKDFENAEATFGKLIKLYPNADNAYLGRAQMYAEKGDTLKAIADADKTISITKTNANAFALRAALEMEFKKDYTASLADLDEAIKLEPQYAPYFVNRAFVKYHLDDYYGAMSDYDYAVELEPSNIVARFNRGLLLAQVRDNNKAIADFSFVIKHDPKNVMARYNRAELYEQTKQYKKAIADYDVVIENVPDVSGLYFARSECKRKSGDRAGGEADYNKSQQLYRQKKSRQPQSEKSDNPGNEVKEHEEQADEVADMFKNLLTIGNENIAKPRYDNKTRGRVQDNGFKINAAPMFFISYYYTVNDLNVSTNFVKEISDLNDMNVLSAPLYINNEYTSLSEEEITRHFNSINYYTGLLSNNNERSIDYFARALDFYMVKNYPSALADLDKAIGLSKDFTLAYFLRASVNYDLNRNALLSEDDTQTQMTGSMKEAQGMLNERRNREELQSVIADLDKVIGLSPYFVYAYYNKGCALLALQDYTSAINAFSKAIEQKPDLGVAYYNRGLAYFNLGNKSKGMADLSKAGELGITPSYSVIKRMSK